MIDISGIKTQNSVDQGNDNLHKVSEYLTHCAIPNKENDINKYAELKRSNQSNYLNSNIYGTQYMVPNPRALQIEKNERKSTF